MPPPHRYPSLDLLRVVAIGMTMLVHTPGLTARVFFLRPFTNGLWLGVDLFMLISGWLLGGQLLRDAKRGLVEPRRFYVKRWLRTLPPYYAMLAVLYFLGDGPQFHGPLPWQVIAAHVSFLQVYAGRNDYMISWSLCVEEHFYLVLPALVAVLLRRPRLAWALGLVATAEVISVVCRIATFSQEVDVPYLSHLRCHGLFLGLLLAWINIHRPELWNEWGPAAAVAGAIGLAGTLLVMASVPPAPSRWMYVGAPTVGTWTLALVFFACVHERCRASRISFRGLQYLGELTYSMYLVHDVIPRAWLGGHVGEGGLAGVVVRVVLVLGLSMILHHAIERPALRLRERILQRWRPASVAVDASPS